MGISIGWAAALFTIGVLIGCGIAIYRHKHDLDAFVQEGHHG